MYGYVWLFCSMALLRYVKLFCGYIGLLCGCIGLFFRTHRVFCSGYIGLFFRTYRALFLGLCCRWHFYHDISSSYANSSFTTHPSLPWSSSSFSSGCTSLLAMRTGVISLTSQHGLHTTHTCMGWQRSVGQISAEKASQCFLLWGANDV